MIVEPPGEPVTSSSLSSLNIIVGVIEDSGRLRGPGALALPPVRPKALGTPGLAAKSSSSSLSRTTGAVGDEADAEGEIQRIGVGDRVAVGIDDREVRGLVALVGRGIDGGDLGRGLGAVRFDEAAQLGGIGLRDQPLHRHVDDGGVAEIFGAVGIGEFFRLGHVVDGFCGERALRLQG